jgi:hypothetical protein
LSSGWIKDTKIFGNEANFLPWLSVSRYNW